MSRQQYSITLRGQIINYISHSTNRNRNVRLTIQPTGHLSVSKPRGLSQRMVKRFICQKADWILEKIDNLKNQPLDILQQGSQQDYLNNKKKAQELIHDRLNYFNKIYNFSYQRISVRNQRSRWGSCSRQGNLNFNYHLIYLPSRLSDYIIVHELCHLKEMNHSIRFWQLVAQTIPNYKDLRKQLRNKLY